MYGPCRYEIVAIDYFCTEARVNRVCETVILSELSKDLPTVPIQVKKSWCVEEVKTSNLEITLACCTGCSASPCHQLPAPERPTYPHVEQR
jgi:hypothetical protein